MAFELVKKLVTRSGRPDPNGPKNEKGELVNPKVEIIGLPELTEDQIKELTVAEILAVLFTGDSDRLKTFLLKYYDRFAKSELEGTTTAKGPDEYDKWFTEHPEFVAWAFRDKKTGKVLDGDSLTNAQAAFKRRTSGTASDRGETIAYALGAVLKAYQRKVAATATVTE